MGRVGLVLEGMNGLSFYPGRAPDVFWDDRSGRKDREPAKVCRIVRYSARQPRVVRPKFDDCSALRKATLLPH